jgi:hypothetical protein
MLKNFILILSLVCQTINFGYPYSAFTSSSFDSSPGPYGWFYGYNRKVQVNLDPVTGKTLASLYRELNTDYGTGTIGGMAGVWENSLSSIHDPLYVNSIYQSEGNLPGGRYPYVSEFINGYCFCQFNDYDTASDSTVSQPMFTIADATWGYDWTSWSEPDRVESADSASVIPNAWRGTGDVVYDPVTANYYWVQGWKEGPADLTTPVSCVFGKTFTPGDGGSWEWSDYKNFRFETDNIIDKYSDVSMIGPLHFSYAKDIYGNGTGKGIGVAVTGPDSAGIPQLSYIFTNNWGQDWNKTSLGFHHQPVSELFDWIGESLTLTDSIGYNLDSLKVFSGSGAITIDYARIMWDISVITTEENIVHVLCMAFPASTDYPSSIFPWTDSGFKAGYYDIRGEITDAGVNWLNAVFISNPIANHLGWEYMEFVSDINRTLSLSYTGDGKIFASWLDRPATREIPTDEIPGCKYIDDGFLIISLDNGNTWKIYSSDPFNTGNPEDPVWYLKYAENVTRTNSRHEEGWSLSNHGYYDFDKVVTYAGSQYVDYTPVIGMTYMDYNRFLHIWKATFTYDGIEKEDVSMVDDFELYQNYPNPFNPATEIKFALSDASSVKLKIYNSNGQLIRTLLDCIKEKGLHIVNFNGEELNSDIYFCQLDVNGKIKNKKMIMLK